MKVTTEQVEVGDTLRVWWFPGRDTVVSLVPYKGRLKLGDGTKIAGFALNKTGMTLVEGDVFEVIR